MNVVQGDLIALALDGAFDVIIHGCNCECAMHSGIAGAIRATLPEAHRADDATKKGDASKLGGFSSAVVERGGHTLTIVNGYTQVEFTG